MRDLVPAAGPLRDLSDVIAEAFLAVAWYDYDRAAEAAAVAVAEWLRAEQGYEVDR